MFRTKNVLHVAMNDSDPVGQVVPIIIYISPENDLEWFNETAPDPTYFEQIVERLQRPDEWAAVRALVLALDAPPTKKLDTTGPRECLLPHIKFTYDVRCNTRGYNVLLSRSKTNFAPSPMAPFEVAVWCTPKNGPAKPSTSSGREATRSPPPPPNTITIDDD